MAVEDGTETPLEEREARHWRAIISSVGPSPALPAIGGGFTELLIGGPLLATFQTTHDGTTAQFAVHIHCDPSIIGMSWAAQATVAGGGRVDLSTALTGVVR